MTSGSVANSVVNVSTSCVGDVASVSFGAGDESGESFGSAQARGAASSPTATRAVSSTLRARLMDIPISTVVVIDGRFPAFGDRAAGPGHLSSTSWPHLRFTADTDLVVSAS